MLLFAVRDTTTDLSEAEEERNKSWETFYVISQSLHYITSKAVKNFQEDFQKEKWYNLFKNSISHI